MSAYTMATGPYNVDQVDGLACSSCGLLFHGAAKTRRGPVVDGRRLTAHAKCRKAVTSR